MSQPPLEVLRHEPLPEVAAALRTCAPRILAEWRRRVIDVLPQADELTRKQLDNSIPRLIEQLAEALAAENSTPTDRLIADAPAHGETRFHQDFNINDMLVDYQILRSTVIEALDEELGRPLSAHESIGLHSGLDVGMRRSAAEFARHLSDEITQEAETMSKYLSFLSHDLRGGLNGAILMIEVLKRDLAAEPKFASSMDDLDVVRRSMLETVATMDRFLHAERLRRGKMPVRIAELDLRELMASVVRNAQHQLSEHKSTVELDLAEPTKIQGDRDALAIILQNLLSNAAKYSAGKPVKIVSRPRGGGKSGDGGLRISVIDQGPGIAAEKMAILFAPFSRGETYGKKGIGLGLTIVRQAAVLLGGQVTAESQPGEGAVFHLDLPPVKVTPA
ncbi:MAG: HAMP domain-containing histidine kinase [Anaerolineae bacterium]|nr:HAMP domain-containing histidine kinase [Phycisphaerae bacterium]